MRNKEKEPVMLAPFLTLWNVHNDIYYLHIMDKTLKRKDYYSM